jgi:hypothetical protein
MAISSWFLSAVLASANHWRRRDLRNEELGIGDVDVIEGIVAHEPAQLGLYPWKLDRLGPGLAESLQDFQASFASFIRLWRIGDRN